MEVPTSIQWVVFQLLTYCVLVDAATVIRLRSPFGNVGVLSLFCRFYSIFGVLLASTVGSDQTPHNVASDLSLHFLPMTLLRVSS